MKTSLFLSEDPAPPYRVARRCRFFLMLYAGAWADMPLRISIARDEVVRWV